MCVQAHWFGLRNEKKYLYISIYLYIYIFTYICTFIYVSDVCIHPSILKMRRIEWSNEDRINGNNTSPSKEVRRWGINKESIMLRLSAPQDRRKNVSGNRMDVILRSEQWACMIIDKSRLDYGVYPWYGRMY